MVFSSSSNEAQGLLPDDHYKQFGKRNRKQLKDLEKKDKSDRMSGEKEMMFVGGMTTRELSHITKTGQDPEKYLKVRREKYGY